MKNVGLIALVFCLFTMAVSADIITVQVTAEITQFDDYGDAFGGGISVGNTLVMTYSYDSETADSNPSTTEGVYYQTTPFGVTAIVGSYSFQSDMDNLNYYIYLNQDITGDTYLVRSTNNIIPTGDYTGEFDLYWQIIYSTGTLKNTNLPVVKPELSSLDSIQIGNDRDFKIVATPTSVEIIPEPITLLTFGLGGLIIRVKRS